MIVQRKEEKMAIAPKDLRLSAQEMATVNDLESEIDSALRRNFSDERRFVDVQLNELMTISHRVRNELERRYKAAGWDKIEFFSGGQWTFHM